MVTSNKFCSNFLPRFYCINPDLVLETLSSSLALTYHLESTLLHLTVYTSIKVAQISLSLLQHSSADKWLDIGTFA